MSDTLTTHLTHTVSISRKVSDGNYGSTEATFFMQFDTPIGATPDDVLQKADLAFAACRYQVNHELGLPILDGEPDQGMVPQQGTPAAAEAAIRQEFPGTQTVSQGNVTPIQQAPTAQAALSERPPFDPETKDRDERKANNDWGKQRQAQFPAEFWDNAEKKASGAYKQSAPDFKHKDTGCPVWL